MRTAIKIHHCGTYMFAAVVRTRILTAANNAGLIQWNPEPTIKWEDFRRFVDDQVDDIINTELSAVEFE